MQAPSATSITAYWNAVAPRYLELFRNEFDSKPYDLKRIAAFCDRLGKGARVCDAGCGPCAHLSRMITDRGLEVLGIDISPVCIELARLEGPTLHFAVMDMSSMTIPSATLDGLLNYYSLHYMEQLQLQKAFQEFARVLKPGGSLLLAAKEGSQADWINCPMGSGERVYWREFNPAELEMLAKQSGFEQIQCEIREPLPGEIASRRIYLEARRA